MSVRLSCPCNRFQKTTLGRLYLCRHALYHGFTSPDEALTTGNAATINATTRALRRGVMSRQYTLFICPCNGRLVENKVPVGEEIPEKDESPLFLELVLKAHSEQILLGSAESTMQFQIQNLPEPLYLAMWTTVHRRIEHDVLHTVYR